MTMDSRDRRARFAALDGEPFDLTVIGGGITGAGIARDAALRGLRVALVEARDFASGTSSRSSKMIHGGLRYLAQGDLALVREAASERQMLRRIAPHLTRLTPFLIPTVSMAMATKLRAGLWTFEKLGGVPEQERHEVIGLAELRRREPLLRSEGLNGAVVYPEFLTDDARLVLANVRSAVAAGAIALNYAAAVKVGADRVEVRSTLAGEDLGASIGTKVVVNAAGAWVDHVRALEAGEGGTRLMLSRGIHIVVARERLPIDSTLILRAPDKRSIFAVPRGEVTYLGTTDIFQDSADYWPAPSRADVDYLLATAAERLDTAPVADADITAIWSGVRPLIAQAGKKPSEVSRKDEVWVSPAGMISIAGGKLSAYRAMAERVVDQVVERLGRAALPCTTADETLPGGNGAPADADPRLAALYGDEADLVAGGVAEEAARAVTHEAAATLEDYWVRRSARAWFDRDAGGAALKPAAAAMGALLGWDAAEQAAQIAACRAIDAESRAVLDKGE